MMGCSVDILQNKKYIHTVKKDEKEYDTKTKMCPSSKM
jgi:hypothetical protein